jgi:hypothetical protein
MWGSGLCPCAFLWLPWSPCEGQSAEARSWLYTLNLWGHGAQKCGLIEECLWCS